MIKYISKSAILFIAAFMLTAAKLSPEQSISANDTVVTISSERADSVVNAFSGSCAQRNAHVSLCIEDLRTNKVLAFFNKDRQLIPASITKLITSVTALKALTPAYRFTTTVDLEGSIDNGVLHGDLIINAGLDPTLESRFFPDHESFIVRCIEELKKKGIKKITGSVKVNRKAHIGPAVPEDWEDADVTEDYGSGVHALNYADNVCSLIFDVSGQRAKLIETLPHQKKLTVTNRITTTRSRRKAGYLRASRKKNSNDLLVSGTVLRQNSLRELRTTTPDPADALECDLTEALDCEEIEVGNHANTKKKGNERLLSHQSPLLEDIIKSLLFRSDNMYAEAVQRAIALVPGKSSSRESALEREYDILNNWGIDTSGQTIYDGSGLSRTNRYSAAFLADVLSHAAADPQTGMLLPTLLPVCGYEGTVRNLLKGTALEGKIALKSGSMNGVLCYAGYYPTGQPQYAVVVMVNGYRCGYGAVKSKIENLLLGLFCGE